MDGILILVLIGWALSKMNKKAKKQIKSFARAENTAARRAERIAKMPAETEKRTPQTAVERTEPNAEGEGTFQFSMLAEEPFRGSMQVESMEGECICEPELEHKREEKPEPASVYADEIGREPLVDFSPRGMMQGIVMSEILTRPVERARRR